MVLSTADRQRIALEEVRQHRPPGEHSVITLEFRHPGFPQGEAPRVVHDNADLTARLETGQVATFIGTRFSAIGPATGENRWPKIELGVDIIGGELERHLDAALATDDPVEVVFREYLRSWAMDGPSRVIAGLELDNTTTGDITVRGTAGYFGFDTRFGRIYDPSIYPSLG